MGQAAHRRQLTQARGLRHLRGLLHLLVKGGGWNLEWLGETRLEGRRDLCSYLTAHWPAARRLLDELNQADTQRILRLFFDQSAGPPSQASGCASAAGSELERLVDGYCEPLEFCGRSSRADCPDSNRRPSFSVVIPFARHLKLLGRCLASLDKLRHPRKEDVFEVVVVNDDAQYSLEELRALMPLGLRPLARVAAGQPGSGIATTLNQAIALSGNEWILFVDCDDLVEPDALTRLEWHIRRHPKVRYISSNMIDIDEGEGVLRYRRRVEPPTELLSRGMIAGHLKCLRRDALDEYGPLEPEFDGCQDYDLALKMSFVEPILLIPEYLYRYRWHQGTQSVSRVARQELTTQAIRRIYKAAAMMERGLLRAGGGVSVGFEGKHSAAWAEVFGSLLPAGGGARVRVSCGELEPSPHQARRLMVELARVLLGPGTGRRAGPFEIDRVPGPWPVRPSEGNGGLPVE